MAEMFMADCVMLCHAVHILLRFPEMYWDYHEVGILDGRNLYCFLLKFNGPDSFDCWATGGRPRMSTIKKANVP